MNFIYKCCNVHFAPLKDEKEQIVLFKMNKKEQIVHSEMNKLFRLSEIEKKYLCNYRTLYNTGLLINFHKNFPQGHF